MMARGLRREGTWTVLVLVLASIIAEVSARGLLQDNARTGCAAPAYAQPPRGLPAPAVELKNGQFARVSDGKPVAMHGYNWFGFNNRMTFLNGLWAGQASANSDFAAIVWQLKLLGFNAIRLPFIFGDLKSPAAEVSGYCSSQSTLAELAKRTVDPENTTPITRASPKPPVPLPDVSVAGSCNKYIPGGRTMDRFLWTVQWLIANGMYVLIDYHPMGLETTSYTAADFVSSWASVWQEVSCLPNFNKDMAGRLFVDILNEPDSVRQGWAAAQGRAGTTELYLGVMDKLWQMSPGKPIFLINGGGQGLYAGLNWGDGFITDKAIIKEYKIDDANPFFTALMKKPYLNRVVISPHIYGPSVSTRHDWFAGPAWMHSLDVAFGYLNKKGYCLDGKCHKFPIAVGEFGSRFKDPEDLQHLHDLALYLNTQGAGNTGGHNTVTNWFYWCYNANSGDTGGLVDDSWMNLEWVKLRYLRDKLGLTPWYQKPAAPQAPQAAAVPKPHVQHQPAHPVAAALPKPHTPAHPVAAVPKPHKPAHPVAAVPKPHKPHRPAHPVAAAVPKPHRPAHPVAAVPKPHKPAHPFAAAVPKPHRPAHPEAAAVLKPHKPAHPVAAVPKPHVVHKPAHPVAAVPKPHKAHKPAQAVAAVPKAHAATKKKASVKTKGKKDAAVKHTKVPKVSKTPAQQVQTGSQTSG